MFLRVLLPVLAGPATEDLLSMPERNVCEVWAKLDAVDAQLFRRADPVFESAFACGLAEPYEEFRGGLCAFASDLRREREASTLSATREIRGKRWRVVLDPEEFPDLYVLKDESVRLRRVAEFFARTGGPPAHPLRPTAGCSRASASDAPRASSSGAPATGSGSSASPKAR